MEYRPGRDSPADYMLRHPITKNTRSSREEEIAEEYVDFVAHTSVPNAITLKELQAATAEDKAPSDGGMVFTSMRLMRTYYGNRPFPSSCLPSLESESKCEVFVMVISSTLHMNEN